MKYFDADAQTLKPMTVDANYNWDGRPREFTRPAPSVADDPATDAFLRSAIQRIEFGLGQATKDNITSVTIDGVTWIHAAPKNEGAPSQKLAPLGTDADEELAARLEQWANGGHAIHFPHTLLMDIIGAASRIKSLSRMVDPRRISAVDAATSPLKQEIARLTAENDGLKAAALPPATWQEDH